MTVIATMTVCVFVAPGVQAGNESSPEVSMTYFELEHFGSQEVDFQSAVSLLHGSVRVLPRLLPATCCCLLLPAAACERWAAGGGRRAAGGARSEAHLHRHCPHGQTAMDCRCQHAPPKQAAWCRVCAADGAG